MTYLLSYSYLACYCSWFYLSFAVSVFANSTRDQIMAARAEGSQVILYAFIRDFCITIWSVVYLQLIPRAVFVAQSAKKIINFKPGFAFLCPFFGCDVLLVGHHKHTAAVLRLPDFLSEITRRSQDDGCSLANKKRPAISDGFILSQVVNLG